MALTATLVPSADNASTGSPTVTGAATKWQALTSSDDDTSYVQFGAAGTVSCVMGDMPAALGVDSVTITVRYKFPGAASDQQTRAYLIIGGSSYNGTLTNSQSASYAELTFAWTLNPATSTPFTPAVVNAMKVGIEYSTAGAESIRYTYLKAAIVYTPTPANISAARGLASRDLWMMRQPQSHATLVGNLDLMVPGFRGRFAVEHTAAPHPSENGWEDEEWQRRPMVARETTIDPNNCTVTVTARDVKPYLCLFRDLAWSDKASGALGDGIARFATPGATFTFTRASEATFTNPVGESETVAADVPAYADEGLQILAAAGSRAQDVYYVTNNTGERTWNAARGTFECEVNLAAVSAGNQLIVCAYHDASNYAAVYWDGAAGRWKFDYRAGGATSTAYLAASPSSGTWYQIGARWLGAGDAVSGLAEYGGTARAISIFVDRVKGTDATAGASMTESASANVEIGAITGVFPLNGQIRKIASYAYPKSDLEMSRTI